MTSTNPTAGAGTWTSANVDGANLISSVSCPSVSLCVAVDTVGNMLVSQDPAGGSTAWTVYPIDSNSIDVIECPTTALCVAGDSQGNVLTSTDPTGGSTAWSIGHVDDSQNYECEHYGETGPMCAVGADGISCPTASFCVLVDSSAGEYSSADPSAGASSWTGTGGGEPESEGYAGVACPSLTLCVTATGYGGQMVTWDPNPPPGTAAGYQYTTLPLSYSFLIGPVCASSTMCFVTGGGAELIGTSDPTGPASAWNLEYSDPEYSIASISCPSTSSCLAVDYNGDLIIGGTGNPIVGGPPSPTPPSPTNPSPTPPSTTLTYPTAQIKTSIRVMLTRLKRAHIGALLKRAGYRTEFRAPVAGRIKLTFDFTVSRPATRRRARQLVVATKTVSYSRSGELRHFAVRLNRTGKRLLMHRRSTTLQATIRFLSGQHPPVVIRQRLSLRR